MVWKSSAFIVLIFLLLLETNHRECQAQDRAYVVSTVAVIDTSSTSKDCLTGIVVGDDGVIYVANVCTRSIYKINNGQVTTLVNRTLKNPNKLFLDKQGNLFCADLYLNTIYKITPDGTVAAFSGSGTAGHLDGSAEDARFDKPTGIVINDKGILFVADNDNHVIRQINFRGEASTFAGTARTVGGNNGPANKATFSIPVDITIGADGNFYVAELYGHRIRRISPKGVVSAVAGAYEHIGPIIVGDRGYKNGPGHEARFDGPIAIVADKTGNLYVSDYGNRVIRKITKDGTVTTFAGNKNYQTIPQDGKALEAIFYSPRDIAIDQQGNIYVADGTAVRKIAPAH